MQKKYYRERIEKAGTIRRSPARCLSEVSEKEFNVVLLMAPAISADDESYNNLQGKQRQLWLDLLCEISTEQSSMEHHVIFSILAGRSDKLKLLFKIFTAS